MFLIMSSNENTSKCNGDDGSDNLVKDKDSHDMKDEDNGERHKEKHATIYDSDNSTSGGPDILKSSEKEKKQQEKVDENADKITEKTSLSESKIFEKPLVNVSHKENKEVQREEVTPTHESTEQKTQEERKLDLIPKTFAKEKENCSSFDKKDPNLDLPRVYNTSNSIFEDEPEKRFDDSEISQDNQEDKANQLRRKLQLFSVPFASTSSDNTNIKPTGSLSLAEEYEKREASGSKDNILYSQTMVEIKGGDPDEINSQQNFREGSQTAANIQKEKSGKFTTSLHNNGETYNEDNNEDREEHKSNSYNQKPEDTSDTETLILDSPPRINKARAFDNTGTDYEEDDLPVVKRPKIPRRRTADDDGNVFSRNSYRENKSEDYRPPIRMESGTKKPYKIKRDSSGRSLLQRACKRGDLNEVLKYLERGADPNESDFCGFTCLHEAALEGHLEVVNVLLEKGAAVNKQSSEVGDLETPLMDAAENKHIDIVKTLLEHGADPRIFNINGFTALTKICNEHEKDESYEELVDLLEEASSKAGEIKSDDNFKLPSHDSRSRSVIYEDPNDIYFSELLKKRNNSSLIYKFAAEGAKEATANYFVEGGKLAFKPDILILAARNGHMDLVDIILGLNPGGFDIDQRNNCGLTALLASVGRGHYEVVNFLLSNGADPMKKRRPDGLNALEIAERAPYYDPKEVELLSEYLKKATKADERDTITSRRLDPEICNKLGGVTDEDKERTDKEEMVKRARSTGHDFLERSVSSESLNKSTSSREVHVKTEPYLINNLDNVQSDSANKKKEHLPKEATEKSPTRNKSASPQDTDKSQESQKLRNSENAERAKVWQEKMDAKKRVKKDMFLKMEREKEKQRMEEEAEKTEFERKMAKNQEEEGIKKAEELKIKVKENEKRKSYFIKKKVLESYPVGLRNAKFGLKLDRDEIYRYVPIYVFDIGNEEYAIDLQVSLLSGTSIPSLEKALPRINTLEIESSQKSKLWSIFFPMIGMGESPRMWGYRYHEEYPKFQNLFLKFVRLNEVKEYFASNYYDIYDILWNQENITKVNLESLEPHGGNRNIYKRAADDESTPVEAIKDSCFIPPNLVTRDDALRSIYNSRKPLW